MKKILLVMLACPATLITANAQLIFHDINPDAVLNQVTQGSISHTIDMNNDGQSDFQIINSFTTVGDSTYSKSIVVPDSGNAVATDDFYNPLALTPDTIIDSSFNFQTDDLGPLREVISAFSIPASFRGDWLNGYDRFLGVRFKDNGSTKYGWIEMSVTSNQAIVVTTIMDYAYEDSGTAILTQDSLGIVGITDVEKQNDILIFSTPCTAIVKYTGELATPLHISIADILGRDIKEVTTKANEVHINLSSVPIKVCVITVQAGNEVVRKKILVM